MELACCCVEGLRPTLQSFWLIAAVRQRRVHYIRAIVVAHCPDANAPAVADSAMMLLLAVTRHLLEADRFVRAGGWQEHWRVETPIMTGKRLGMLGLGRIGS